MARSPRALHWLDWVVFAATLVISLCIGIYYALTGGRQKTTKEYLMGNRQLQVVPVSLSMFMSFISAIYILGTTAEVYTNGAQILLQLFGYIAGYFLAACIFVPVLHPLKLTSSFEYIEHRFKHRPLRMLLVVSNIGFQIAYMGIAMFAPATALEGVTGFPVWASILISGGVTTIYTTMGGMKAVVWTDVFQGVVLLGGILIVLILGTIRVGGLAEVWEIARKGNRLNFFEYTLFDPTKRLTFWPVIVGQTYYCLSFYGSSQAYVQRYCALPTKNKAKLSLILCSLYISLLLPIVGLCGLVMYAYFTQIGCDPLRDGVISNSNQLLPYFTLTVLEYPGLNGLLLAVLFSGALSSLSSSMNSLSAVTWKDIMEPRFKGKKEEYKAFITKILVLVYGVLAIAVSFLMEILPGHVIQVANRILGALLAPMNGTVALGILFPFANGIGGIVGSVVSMAMTLVMNIGSYITVPHRYRLPTDVTNCTFSGNATALPNPTDPPPESIFALFRISAYWIPAIGPLTVIIVGIVTSFLTGGYDVSNLKPSLVLPISNYLCWCCPESVRRFFWCGVDHDRPDDTDDKECPDEQEMDRDSVPSRIGFHRNSNSVRKSGIDSPMEMEFNSGDPRPISYIAVNSDRL